MELRRFSLFNFLVSLIYSSEFLGKEVLLLLLFCYFKFSVKDFVDDFYCHFLMENICQVDLDFLLLLYLLFIP